MTYECLGREFFEYFTHKICIRVAQREEKWNNKTLVGGLRIFKAGICQIFKIETLNWLKEF